MKVKEAGGGGMILSFKKIIFMLLFNHSEKCADISFKQWGKNS